MTKKKIDNRGFTLIELLIVIAIIGILSSVVLVSLQSSRAKARDAKRIADVDSMKTALVLYADSNGGHYPNSLSDLTPKYFPTIPMGPNNGEYYSYVSSPDHLSYHLGAALEQLAPYQGVLLTDIDCSSLTGATSVTVPPLCKGFSAGVTAPPAVPDGTPGGFSGADPVYDVTP